MSEKKNFLDTAREHVLNWLQFQDSCAKLSQALKKSVIKSLRTIRLVYKNRCGLLCGYIRSIYSRYYMCHTV